LLQAAAIDALDPALSADDAIARQRVELRAAIRACPDSLASDEIVICAASTERSRYRLPLPVAREPGAVTRGRGDMPSGMDALRATEPGCAAGTALCGGGYVDFARVAQVIVRLGRTIAHGED
jgi:hypothetical protein